MNKLSKYLLVGILIVGAIFVLRWVSALAATKEAWYTRLLSQRDSSRGIYEAFIMALWLNNDIAYEVTDPALWPQIDEWMDKHIVQDCSILDPGELDGGGGGNSPGTYYRFSCEGIDLSLTNLRTEYDDSDQLRIIHWEVRHNGSLMRE